jgi:hypothetical protein
MEAGLRSSGEDLLQHVKDVPEVAGGEGVGCVILAGGCNRVASTLPVPYATTCAHISCDDREE